MSRDQLLIFLSPAAIFPLASRPASAYLCLICGASAVHLLCICCAPAVQVGPSPVGAAERGQVMTPVGAGNANADDAPTEDLPRPVGTPLATENPGFIPDDE